jgi:hypothetical protein
MSSTARRDSIMAKVDGFLLFGLLVVVGAGVLFMQAGRIISAHGWKPVRVPLPLAPGQSASTEFTSDLNGEYDVQIDLQRNSPPEELDRIEPPWLRCSVSSDGRPVRLERSWKKHYTGENAWANWSYWSSDNFGSVIGRFQAVPGQHYRIHVWVQQAAPKLGRLNPHLEVIVAPAIFEEAALKGGLLQVLAWLLLLIGLASLAVGPYRSLQRSRGMGEHGPAPTPT